MTSPSRSNSTCAERHQSPSSPTFKSTLGPMDHALMATAETKSSLSLVMDVTKKEEFTTKVLVQRDRAGKLRYSINKESKCKMDGVVGASPSIYNRIREDSLAKDYIPEVGLSKRRRQKRRSNRSRTRNKKPASKDLNATGKSSITSNVNQNDPAGPKNAKPNSDTASKSVQKPMQNKKRLEMICEQSQTRSNEIVFKNSDEPVMGDVPASVENGVVTPMSTKANTTNSEPHQEALQEGDEPLEQKKSQKQSAAVRKCSSKNSSPQFMTAVDTKSPPASPTSKVFRLPPNPEAIKTPSPAGKRAQVKSPPASPVKQIPPTEKLPTSVDGRPTLNKLSLDLEPNQDKQALTSKDDKELKVQSVDTWKSIESKSSIPKPKTNSTTDKANGSATASLSKQQPMSRSVKSLGDIQQSDKSKPEEKDAPTETKLTTPKSVAPKESIVESHPQKVLSRKVSMTPIGKTGNLLSSQTQDSLLMFLTPVPGKSPAGSPTSKMFTIPPNADKIKTPSPPGKSQKEAGTLLPLEVAQSGTPKTQQRKPKSSQSLKSLKSNPSIRIQKDDLKEPSLISVKEKVLTPKEMTPKGDDFKKVQASEELTQDVAKVPENTVISIQTTVKEQPPLASPKQEVLQTEPPKPSPIRDANKVIETPKALLENAEVVAADPPVKSTPKATPKKDPSEEEPKKEAVPVDTSHAEEQKDTNNVKEAEGKSKLESVPIPNQEVGKVIETPKSQPKKTVENEEVVAVCPLDKPTPTGKSFEEEPKKAALVVVEKEPRDINSKKHESEPKSEPKTILITEEQLADLRKTPRSKSPEINTPDSAVYSIPTEELQNMIDKQEGSLEPKSPAKPVSLSTNGTSKKSIGTPSKVQQMVRALENLEPKSKQPNDKQIGSEEAEKDHQPELKITSEKTPSKSIDETTSAPVLALAQPENPKEEIHSKSLKDKTSETETPKEELLAAKGGEKLQPKKSEGSPKTNSEDSRKTPTPTTKPHSEEDPSVVKLQSSMTAFNQKPETVGAPFENVQVQLSDEKVPHNASNLPLQKAIGPEQPEQPETMVTTTVPFKLEPGLEALRLRDEPDKVDVVEPSMMKANDIQPETDQVEPKAKGSSPSPEPPNKLDPHLKFYYHQEANLRSMQTCYGNEISAGSSTVQQIEPIKSEGELIARQEMLMHKGDTFLEQMKEASSKQAAAPATAAAALPSGPDRPVARGSQAQQSQGLSLKAKAVIAAATVAGFVIVAHMVNII